MQKPSFVKISATGDELPVEATDWVAVRDETTGLTWGVKPVQVKNWRKETEETITSAMATSKLAGLDGWRPPTRVELLTLVDDTKYSPAIDTDFFPDTPNDWFWTSTPYAPSPGGYAWYVGFGGGGAAAYGRDCDGFVRAVRASQ